ncbi:hypothetical protein BV210_17990 (plasmid) [Halorientalis sp. IM1011]|uniref:glycosyltransferase family 39 protein n=1 Tax=Halorientalis sp. IM1011 TaxID=1932360 RepID=UPI00097CD0C5|nr:glycosyltransferase family 39 protein [Halorientalis sp. IM1011]AQL44657.1 hypothetical protein BV210_17990 [Halorientalis sp. IM1011]
MAQQTNDARWFDFRLDVAGAILALLLGLAMLPLRFVVSQVYIDTLPLVLVVASLLYLLGVRYSNGTGMPTLSPWLTRLLPTLVFAGMAAMVVVAVHQSRSPLFYYLAVWTGITLLVQVLFSDEQDYHVGLLLTEVVVFGAVVRLAGAYTAPGYVGIDIWSHVANYVHGIANENSLSPIASSKYYASPLFHLLVAVGSQLLDVSIRQALFLTVGIAMPLSTLLVYATADVLVEKRLAVFAAALFALSGNVIEWGIHLIPTSLGLVFFVAIVYALTRIMASNYGPRDYLLVVLFSVAIILTHQISSFVMLVFIGSGLIAKLLLSTGLLAPKLEGGLGGRVRESVNLSSLLVFDLGLLTFMWSLTPYQGSSFLETMFSYFGETLRTSAGFLNLASQGSAGGGGESAAAQPSTFEVAITYVNAMGLVLILLLTVIGSLYVLHRKRTSQTTIACIIAVLVMLVFIFGLPLFGIRTFVPGRWPSFLTAPAAVLAAIGVGYLASETPRAVVATVLVLFAVTYPPVTLLSSQGSLDSPPFDGVQTRYSYTESELAAVETINGTVNTSRQDQLSADHPYGTVFERAWGTHTEPIAIVNGTSPNGTLVYREYAQTGGAYFRSGQGRAHKPAVDRSQLCGGYGINYDNGQVSVCERGIGTARGN